jgi:DNA-directed RNA polymerase specialized sigma24 family protein
MPQRSAPDVAGLPDRLKAVQQDVEDAQAALDHRREQRRALVVQIVDEGAMSQRQIARALGGKSPGLVVKILATPAPGDEDDEG